MMQVLGPVVPPPGDCDVILPSVVHSSLIVVLCAVALVVLTGRAVVVAAAVVVVVGLLKYRAVVRPSLRGNEVPGMMCDGRSGDVLLKSPAPLMS